MRRGLSLLIAISAASLFAADSGSRRPFQPGSQTRQAAGAINGVVLDHSSKAPIDGATVVLVGPGVARGLQETTDAQGRFSFRAIGPGDSYNVVASKAGYFGGSYGRSVPQFSRTPIRGQSIVVRDGETFGSARVFLWRPASISGTVLGSRGEPMVGIYVRTLARVMVAGQSRLAGGPAAATDDRGAFRITDLARGEYLVAVTGVGAPGSGADQAGTRARVHAPLYHPASIIAEQGLAISVDYGDERVGIDFRVPAIPLGRITGRVTGPLEAVRSALLRLIPAGSDSLGIGAEAATVSPNADGTFTFPNVPSGAYTVRVTPTMGEIALPHAPNLPLPSGIQYRSGRSEPDGLAIRVLGPAVPSLFWGEAAVTITDRNREATGVGIALRPTASISGTMVSAGKRPTTAAIVAEPADGNPAMGRPTARADAEGRFTLEGLLPGAYVLRLAGAGIVESVTWEGRDVADASLDLSSGRDAVNVVVTLRDAGGALTGSVRDADGKPAPDSVVVYFPKDAASWQLYGLSSPRIGRALVNSLGEYRIGGLPAGDYHVIAIPETAAETWRDPAYLRRASGSATAVHVAWEGVQTTHLRVQTMPAR